jgi:hypothetical protein
MAVRAGTPDNAVDALMEELVESFLSNVIIAKATLRQTKHPLAAMRERSLSHHKISHLEVSAAMSEADNSLVVFNVFHLVTQFTIQVKVHISISCSIDADFLPLVNIRR